MNRLFSTNKENHNSRRRDTLLNHAAETRHFVEDTPTNTAEETKISVLTLIPAKGMVKTRKILHCFLCLILNKCLTPSGVVHVGKQRR